MLFSQGGSLLSSGFPRSRDNFIALAHDGGFVSLYSSPSLALSARLKKNGVARDEIVGTIEGARGGQEDNYYLRVIDNSSKLVVNHALFSPGMIDRAAPRIEEVSLIKEGFRLKAEPERRILQRLAQGDYKLAIRLNDPSYAGGVYPAYSGSRWYWTGRWRRTGSSIRRGTWTRAWDFSAFRPPLPCWRTGICGSSWMAISLPGAITASN